MKRKTHRNKMAAVTIGMAAVLMTGGSWMPVDAPVIIANAAEYKIAPTSGKVDIIGPPGSEQDEEPEEAERTLWPTKDEEEMLMKIAMAEAEGEGVKGKALVIRVVINRTIDKEFPDDIEGVVFQKNAFETTSKGGRYWTTTPNDECREALEMVTHGWDDTEGARFFEATWSTSTWHRTHLEYLFTYGNHIFYK